MAISTRVPLLVAVAFHTSVAAAQPGAPAAPAGSAAPMAQAPASAFELPPPPPPAEPSRTGFLLLGELGLAGHASGRDQTTVSGGGVNLRVAAGGMVSRTIALIAGVSYFASSDVTVEQNNIATKLNGASLSATSWFVGARAYTRSGFYFEGTLGTLSETATDNSDSEIGSDTGWIVGLGLGKEWILPSRLTLGVGARLGLGQVQAQDGGTDPVVAHLDLGFTIGFAGGE
jgi:hypothetical protein